MPHPATHRAAVTALNAANRLTGHAAQADQAGDAATASLLRLEAAYERRVATRLLAWDAPMADSAWLPHLVAA